MRYYAAKFFLNLAVCREGQAGIQSSEKSIAIARKYVAAEPDAAATLY